MSPQISRFLTATVSVNNGSDPVLGPEADAANTRHPRGELMSSGRRMQPQELVIVGRGLNRCSEPRTMEAQKRGLWCLSVRPTRLQRGSAFGGRLGGMDLQTTIG